MSALMEYLGDLVGCYIVEGLVSECCDAEVASDGNRFWCTACRGDVRKKKRR